jgi:peptidoglycan/LPS O-acetylase OafA/YrhL
MSYSLYLFHFPLAAFLFAAPVRIQPSPYAYLQFLLVLAAVIGFGYAMWWLFERHTDEIRRFLRDRIGIRKAGA